MMHLYVQALFVAFTLLLLPIQAHAETPQDKIYLSFVDGLTATSATEEWTKLRELYPETSFFREHMGESALIIKKAAEAAEKAHKEKTSESIDAYKKILREHFAHITIQMHAAGFEKQNNTGFIDESLSHAAVKGIIDSIMATGDGKTMKTAFRTITDQEDRAVVLSVYRLRIIGQTTEGGFGKIFNSMSVRSGTNGPPMEIFFDATDRWKKQQKAAAPDKAVTTLTARNLVQPTENLTAADTAYLALVDAAVKNIAAADWDALREAYPQTSFFKAAGGTSIGQRARMASQFMGNRQTPEAIDGFKTYQRQHFAASGLQSVSLDVLKRYPSLDFINAPQAQQALDGIYASIIKSGDGKTTQTAFKVISGDEIDFVQSRLLKSTGTPIAKLDGDTLYNTLTGPDATTGEMRTYIFAVDASILTTNSHNPHGHKSPVQNTAINRDAADKTYLSLVDAAQKDPAKADWQGIRFAYAETSFYHPYGAMMLGDAFNKARGDAMAYQDLQRKHFGHFITHRHAQTMATTGSDVPVNPTLARIADAGIMKSIMQGADGRSVDTAFKVIDIQEEYTLMREVLKIKSLGKSLVQDKGRVFDVFSYNDPVTGAPSKIYFDATLPFSRGID